jgi:methyl-accepting chemotaxis protein
MKSFRNWSIRAKLLSGFSVLSLIAVVIGYTGIASIRAVDEADTELYEEATAPLGRLVEVGADFQKVAVALRDMLAIDDSTAIDEEGALDEFLMANHDARRAELAGTIKGYIDHVSAVMLDVEQSVTDPTVRTAVAAFDQARARYAVPRTRVMELSLARDNEQARDVYQSEYLPALGDTEERLAELGQTMVQAAADIAERNTQITNAAVVGMVVMIVFGLILAAALALWMSGRMSQAISRLGQAAERVAQGDTTATVAVDSQDELGRLSASFNTMVENIRTAAEDLENEKAGVERKVEEAVRASEEARLYLDRSVERMLTVMDQFAEGDLTVHIANDRDDEITKLFGGFTRAVDNVRKLMSEVHEAIETVSSTSIEIGAASEQLASSTQEQSSQTSEVAAATEQMVRTIIDNTRTASFAADAATSSGKTAREGTQIMGETLDKIHRIANVVRSAATTVEKLGDSSEQIGNIIQVIDEIADQTNLLALNAAIEAARAGEQGRGFAVVADEVRKLAERTTGATREIAGMIKGIQAETAEAVRSMQVGSSEVDEGLELAGRAGTVLEAIQSSAEKTVDMVTQIAAAGEEQSSTSEQISRSIEMISTVSQDSALGVNQIAQSVDRLNRLTNELHLLVSRFNLRADASKDRTSTTAPSRARSKSAVAGSPVHA